MAYSGLDISGKICLITGGTSGIGLAIAKGFAEAGATVVVGSTNPEKVLAALDVLGEGHDAVRIDVSDEATVKAAVDRVRDRFGRIDAVVNAAGIIKRQPSLDMPVAEF